MDGGDEFSTSWSLEDFLWETKQEGVAVVKPGGDETVD